MYPVLVASRKISSTFAATAPLPAGKPAGVKEAAFLGPNTLMLLIGLGLGVGGLALAVSNPGGQGITSGTTTSTSTGTSP